MTLRQLPQPCRLPTQPRAPRCSRSSSGRGGDGEGMGRLWGAQPGLGRQQSLHVGRAGSSGLGPAFRLSRGVLILHPRLLEGEMVCRFFPRRSTPQRRSHCGRDRFQGYFYAAASPGKRVRCPGGPGRVTRGFSSARCPRGSRRRPAAPAPKAPRALTSKPGGASPFPSRQPDQLGAGLPGTRPGGEPGGQELRDPRARPRSPRPSGRPRPGTGHFCSAAR